MNKKLITLFVATVAGGNVIAQEATTREVNGGMDFHDVYNMGAKTTYTHWSADIHAGAHVLDYAKDKDGHRFNEKPEVGLGVHYTFTQYWGLGFDFTWYNNNQCNYDNQIFGMGLSADVNVTNLLAPYRQWNKLNVFVNGGAGFPLTTWKNAYVYDNSKKEATDTPLKDRTHIARPYGKVGGLVEYNLTNDFALGLYGNVLGGVTHANNWEGSKCFHPSSNGGRWMVSAGLSFRYKFKGDRNIRNVNIMQAEDYNLELKDQLTLINRQERRIDSLAKATQVQINEVKLENERLQDMVKKQQDSIKVMQERAAAAAAAPQAFNPSQGDMQLIKASMRNLRFESGKAVIMPTSFPGLDRLAKLFNERKDWEVVLSGYTDNQGDEQKNLLLSRDRAAAVKAYLVNKGVDPNRIKSVGYGIQNPIATNDTPEGRARNRRVEVELYKK